jgi:hypothetical protein
MNGLPQAADVGAVIGDVCGTEHLPSAEGWGFLLRGNLVVTIA